MGWGGAVLAALLELVLGTFSLKRSSGTRGAYLVIRCGRGRPSRAGWVGWGGRCLGEAQSSMPPDTLSLQAMPIAAWPHSGTRSGLGGPLMGCLPCGGALNTRLLHQMAPVLGYANNG